jgi:hypothetical protein
MLKRWKRPLKVTDLTTSLSDSFALARIAGDHAVRELAKAALHNDCNDLRCLVDVAIHLRFSCPETSDEILRYILHKDPTSAFGHYELAFSYMLRGLHVEGAHLLDAMLMHHPRDARAIILLARLLCGIGAGDKGLHLLQVKRELVPPGESVIVEQFALYLNKLCCKKALYLAGQHALADSQHVKELILSALRAREGFALTRFGDGEGVFFRSSSEEEAVLAELYGMARLDRARVWFGDEVESVLPKFMPQALQISDVLDASDVAGIPYPSWIEHEYKILSYTGVVGLGNITRHVSALRQHRQVFASQLIHIDLARSGGLREIISSQESCAIISCFAEAPEFVRSSFGVKNVEFYRVPGEKLFVSEIGAAAAEGRHYPNRFESLMRILSKPAHGRLFLVSAGIFGKFYCMQIKKAGGIALDIGSLIDASLGKATRPGYSFEKRLEW